MLGFVFQVYFVFQGDPSFTQDNRLVLPQEMSVNEAGKETKKGASLSDFIRFHKAKKMEEAEAKTQLRAATKVTSLALSTNLERSISNLICVYMDYNISQSNRPSRFKVWTKVTAMRMLT